MNKRLEKDFISLKNLTLISWLLYRFSVQYTDAATALLNRQPDQAVNLVEAYTLASIVETPGMSITQLAQLWNRTTGAISQTATKLENKKLLTRKRQAGNGRNIYLYATKKGEAVVLAQEKYNGANIDRALSHLSAKYTPNELESFFCILKDWNAYLEST